MTDSISKEQRSWNMSQIKSKDTRIEVSVRKYLFSRGLRFRKNDKRYPGKPNVVLSKYHTVIFVNGCFWHHHEGCKYASIPKTRTDFWIKKFKNNIENDKAHNEELKSMGWNVITIWECELKNDFQSTMENVVWQLEVRQKEC